jgi:FMN phosphatase YigB (HAD superfamily)
MVTTIISDFSHVIIFPKDGLYKGSLNSLYGGVSNANGFNFFDYYYLNEELLQFFRSLVGKYRLVIYTTGELQNDPAIKETIEQVFPKIFTVKDTSFPKSDAQGYTKLLEILNVQAGEAIFLDDAAENIVAAKSAGIRAIEYSGNEDAVAAIKTTLLEAR